MNVHREEATVWCPACQTTCSATWTGEREMVFNHPGAVSGDQCRATSQVRINWATDPTAEDRSAITRLLGLNYNEHTAVGTFDVSLAQDARGWRVARAVGVGHVDGRDSDFQHPMREVLRSGGVHLAPE